MSALKVKYLTGENPLLARNMRKKSFSHLERLLISLGAANEKKFFATQYKLPEKVKVLLAQ